MFKELLVKFVIFAKQYFGIIVVGNHVVSDVVLAIELFSSFTAPYRHSLEPWPVSLTLAGATKLLGLAL